MREASPAETRAASSPDIGEANHLKVLLANAQQWFDAGHYEEAQGFFRQALNLHPHSEAARIGLEKTLRAVTKVQNIPGDVDSSASETERKAQTIVVPLATCDRIRFSDAIEFLRRESVRLDQDPVSNRQGLKIAVRFPTEPTYHVPISGLPEKWTPTPSPVSADTVVALIFYNFPLLDALRYVAGQVGMVVRVRADGIYLTGPSEIWPDGLITREFSTPPYFFSSDINTLTGPNGQADADTEAVSDERVITSFKAMGVQFPTGTTARYLPAKRKIVIRDTQENIDLVEALLAPCCIQPTLTNNPANP